MTHTTISHTKARLRDEVQLAHMAYAERGGVITTVRPSRAPVCVPVPQSRHRNLREILALSHLP